MLIAMLMAGVIVFYMCVDNPIVCILLAADIAIVLWLQ